MLTQSVSSRLTPKQLIEPHFFSHGTDILSTLMKHHFKVVVATKEVCREKSFLEEIARN
jgi:hypothetical protein